MAEEAGMIPFRNLSIKITMAGFVVLVGVLAVLGVVKAVAGMLSALFG